MVAAGKLKHLGLIALLAIVFTSCGQAYKTHRLVKDFMTQDMHLIDFDVVQWSDIRPALFVTDSALQAIHSRAEKTQLVRKDLKYAPRTRRLNFIHVTYALGQDTVKQTFYLDDKMEGIVGVKGN